MPRRGGKLEAVEERDPCTGLPEGLGRVGVFTLGLRRLRHLQAFLGAEALVLHPQLGGRAIDFAVGWGHKPNTRLPRAYARLVGAPFIRLEDGLIRSFGLGREGAAPHGILLDDLGVHYDATRPSRLEALLRGGEDEAVDPLAEEVLFGRARGAIAEIRRHALSKYNAAPIVGLGPKTRRRVLVIDQTAGDLSLRLGLVPRDGFERMLRAALDEHPGAEILVKTHPDVSGGHRRGHLSRRWREGRVRLLIEPMNPIRLLEQVDEVYTMTSLMGFEALLCGLPVHCFGMPFYAGWGLTRDRQGSEEGAVRAAGPEREPAIRRAMLRRGRARSVEEVFAAAYLRMSRYVDPETGERTELERILEHLALQRRTEVPGVARITAVGFSAWKRGFVPAFLRAPGARVRLVRDANALEREGLDSSCRIVVWGSQRRPELESLGARHGVEIWRMEDGFLRSVGLGSDLHAPASLVVDRRGIYYDPTRPSELEEILERGDFEPQELARAAALREEIVRRGLSKYNVGDRRGLEACPEGRPLALVIGQVEDDASIQLGCRDIRRNVDLLAAARAARPDARIVFKPHPDVLSGNRSGMVPRAEALAHCDEIVEE
ncbi:MAG: hypothetical protein OEY14_10520, partial [Myxococcales bacterium]|nr:hypothetical protein [Myxococcales bacterium]